MTTRVAAWICVTMAVSVLGACGKAEGGSGPIAKEDLPERFGNVFCNSFAACCGADFDVAVCKQRYEALIDRAFSENGNRVVYDPRAAGDCLNAAQSKIKCGKVEDEDIP